MLGPWGVVIDLFGGGGSIRADCQRIWTASSTASAASASMPHRRHPTILTRMLASLAIYFNDETRQGAVLVGTCDPPPQNACGSETADCCRANWRYGDHRGPSVPARRRRTMRGNSAHSSLRHEQHLVCAKVHLRRSLAAVGRPRRTGFACRRDLDHRQAGRSRRRWSWVPVEPQARPPRRGRCRFCIPGLQPL
jgi:hypothetical protein